jgi:hypothetical protein
MTGPLTGAGNLWQYRSTELGTAVDGAGYFTNAKDLGMKVGDMVLVYESTNVALRTMVVVTVSSTGADLSDGTTVGSTTNSD